MSQRSHDTTRETQGQRASRTPATAATTSQTKYKPSPPSTNDFSNSNVLPENVSFSDNTAVTHQHQRQRQQQRQIATAAELPL
jgi:hypothetical protein